jgi:hypothetical protein
MTDQEHLERAYRRLLAWYPRAFRRESGPELLAVLMACAPDGRRRPGLAESADLIRGGLWMRLRPGVPRSARTVRAAVRLMGAGAAVSIATLIIAVAVIACHAALGLRLIAAQVSQVNAAGITQVIVSCLVPVAVWLWMARASGQGRNWARILFTALFVLTTLTLAGLFPPAQINIQDQPTANNTIVPPSAIHLSFTPLVPVPFIPELGPVLPVLTGLVLPALTWLAGAAAVGLLWIPASTTYFRAQGYLQARYKAQKTELARIRSSRAR